MAKRWGKETLAGGGLDNKQFNDYVPAGNPLAQFFVAPDTVWTPRVLKDGSDSVGALGALNRVYLNIGLFSEEWLLHFNAARRRQARSRRSRSPTREKNSATGRPPKRRRRTWRGSSSQSTDPHHLKDAPGGAALSDEGRAARSTRGKVVFAERCARCHSSKTARRRRRGLDPGGLHRQGLSRRAGTTTGTGRRPTTSRTQMREIVHGDDFLTETSCRPSCACRSRCCRPTPAVRSRPTRSPATSGTTSRRSPTRDLPSVGTDHRHDPFTGAPQTLHDAGRRPRLHAPGVARQPVVDGAVPAEQQRRRLRPSPSVEARMRSFQDAIEQMLWPEKREG